MRVRIKTLHLGLAITMVMANVVHGRSFWADVDDCARVKESMRNTPAPSDADFKIRAKSCIINCLRNTVFTFLEITPQECMTDLAEPYITKVLKESLPDEKKTKKCLSAKDRSTCRDTLLYIFAHWYTTKYSLVNDKKFQRFLFDSWAHHPDLDHTFGFSNWEFSLAKDLALLKFDTPDRIRNAIEVTSLSDMTKFPLIHKELKRYCYKTIVETAKDFCNLRITMTIAKKINELASKKASYSDNYDDYTRAIKFNFVVLSSLYGTHEAANVHPASIEDKVKEFEWSLDKLAELSKAADIDSLAAHLKFMPDGYLLRKACDQTTFSVISKRSCVLVEVQEQLLIHNKMIQKRKSSGTKKAVNINFSMDLRGVITELRGEEIFKMLLDVRYQAVVSHQETMNMIEGKFGQLQGYFVKLQSYNMQKSYADVNYVTGMVDHYQSRMAAIVPSVAEHVGTIIDAAVEVQGLEVGQNTVELAMEVADLWNPFALALGGDSLMDIADAMSELSISAAKLTEAIALQAAWPEVQRLVKKIGDDLQKNSEFLGSVGKIIHSIKLNSFPDDDEFEESKSTFLRLYNAYSPAVTAEDLALLGTKLGVCVSDACNLIDSVGTMAGAIKMGIVKHGRYCPKAEEDVTSLTTVYEEMYNFQFELIESMAEYLRSSTGYHAAQKMVVLAGEPMTAASGEDERTNDLKANILIAHTTYEIQKQSAIESLCDFLEYKEGGKMPEVCQTSLVNVPTLVSYIPKRCTSVNKYVSIPIASSAKNLPHGHIYSKALYRGEEVSFSVPSYQWLMDNEWIEEHESATAIFIRSLEVFLPTATKANSVFQVNAKVIGGSRLKEDGIFYSLVPTETFRLDYELGDAFSPCSGKKIDHPYTICKKRRLPDVCVLSDTQSYDDPQLLYPSIFTPFRIKVKGVSESQAPDPDTPLDIKARVNLCFLDDGLIRKRGNPARAPKKAIPGCCRGNTYWSKTDSACKDCAGGSKANLKGYYCEKNSGARY